MLQSLNTEGITFSPSVSVLVSPLSFAIKPASNIIAGDLNVLHNDKVRDVLSKSPILRGPRSFAWKHYSIQS